MSEKSTMISNTSLGMKISVEDHSEEILKALENAVERGLMSIGSLAEGYAKEILTETVYTRKEDPDGYKLTGRLRNSITYAISGEKANIQSYTANDGSVGVYEGTAPKDKDKAVYIGTNVVYAKGIETGSHRKAGAVHFLSRASTEHTEEYKALMKDSLENA